MHNPQCASRLGTNKNKAFSLIELFIVIAVISTLTVVITPSITGSMDRAKQLKCLANMKGLYIASNLFAQDHDGIFVHNLNNTTENNQFWVQALAPYVEKITSGVGPHEGIWRCPMSKNVAAGGDHSDYVKNYYLNGDQSREEWQGPHNRNLRIVNLNQPSKVILFLDNNANNNRDCHEWLSDWGIGYRHGRSKKVANVVFVDGHSESLKQTEISFDSSKLPWNPRTE